MIDTAHVRGHRVTGKQKTGYRRKTPPKVLRWVECAMCSQTWGLTDRDMSPTRHRCVDGTIQPFLTEERMKEAQALIGETES